jgi:integrase
VYHQDQDGPAASCAPSSAPHPHVPVKVVSEMLGHSSIAITLDVYAHVLPEMQPEAVRTMQRLLGEQVPLKSG